MIAAALILVAMNPPVASAATTFEIEVGRAMADPDGAASMRFLPGPLEIHQGDTLRFTTHLPYGVVLLPLNQFPSDWRNEHWEEGDWAPFIADPDEGPVAVKVNPLGALPTDPSCGRPGLEPCVFDGTGDGSDGPLNSGVDEDGFLDFTVTIDVAPGNTFAIVNVVEPQMWSSITVVDPGASATDPVMAQEEADALFAADEEAAMALHNRYSRMKKTIKKKGKVYKQAWAGVDQGTVSLRRFYPAKLKIKPGQFVQWNFKQLIYTGQTVTIPEPRGSAIAAGFPTIVCDLDGDDGQSPDTEPEDLLFPYCSDPTELELDVPSGLLTPSGDRKYKAGKDFESSGLRGAGPASSNSSYAVRFPKQSPKSGFSFVSMTHPFMKGKVVVRR